MQKHCRCYDYNVTLAGSIDVLCSDNYSWAPVGKQGFKVLCTRMMELREGSKKRERKKKRTIHSPDATLSTGR